MLKTRFIPALGVAVSASLLLSVSAQAATITFTPDADTYTRSGVDAGSNGELRINRFSQYSDFVGYARFDLSTLPVDQISSASFTLQKTGGATLVAPRHLVYGLTDQTGNTPQDWDESTLAEGNTGDEFAPADAEDSLDESRLDYLSGTEADNYDYVTISNDGTTATVSGVALATFLNDRIDSNGLATLLIDINANDRAFYFGSKENADLTLRPTLSVDYTVVPEPASLALLGLGGLALLGRRRRA